MGQRAAVRWVVLRTAWLLVGAAIGLAAVLLCVSLARVIGPSSGVLSVVVLVVCLLPALVIGLLPGVREIEVTAARSMLGVEADLVIPGRPRPEHRWRTALLVVFHLSAGLLTAVLLVGLVPGLVLLTAASLAGRTEVLAGVPIGPFAAPLALLLGLACGLVCLSAAWALGRLGAAVTQRLLGPTDRDRLEVALTRLEAEAEHVRLARELHDGIGHALTIISVQAAGGRQALSRNPPQAGAALATIEGTARQALTELDGMLGLLRDGQPSPNSTPDLDRLPTLLEAYRSAGMELSVELAALDSVPRLVSTTVYRIVAEALTNAQRYAGPGPVRVTLQQRSGLLTIEASSPLPTGSARPLATGGAGSGHGLRGISERVALFGGTVHAGPDEADWVLRAEIPTGVARD